MLRYGRIATLSLVLIALALSALSSAQTWISVVPAAEAEPIELSGAALARALPATALGIGGIALAFFFARKMLVYICAVLLIVLAIVQVQSVLQGMTVENPAVELALAEATGIAGGTAFDVSLAWLWPSLALSGAGIAVLAALLSAATVHRWPQAKRKTDKYDIRSGALAWDALDDGDDPTLSDDDRPQND